MQDCTEYEESSDNCDNDNTNDIFDNITRGENYLQETDEIQIGDNGETLEFCPFCNLPFTNDDEMLNHVENEHYEEIKNVSLLLLY